MPTVFHTAHPVSSKIAKIVNFVNNGLNFYVGIGKATEWDNSYGNSVTDENPPLPSSTTVELIEPIIYKRVKCVAPATVNRTGFIYNKVCETLTNTNELLNNNILIKESEFEKTLNLYSVEDIKFIEGQYNIVPDYIYIQAEIEPSEYREESWRCSALFTNLILKEGVSSSLDIYTPDQVEQGYIEQITFNSPVFQVPNKLHRFEYLISL